MGRPSRGRARGVGKQFSLTLTDAELEKMHQRARAAGFKTTAEWARRRLLEDPSSEAALTDFLRGKDAETARRLLDEELAREAAELRSRDASRSARADTSSAGEDDG